jgi:hypothetical protein
LVLRERGNHITFESGMGDLLGWLPNDPSSATPATRGDDCNRDAMPPFAEAHG